MYFLDGVLTLVLMRGDHALHEQKLVDATGAVARSARREPEEIRAALGALPGSLGAVGTQPASLGGHPVIADEALRGRRGMYTGANVDDAHLRGVDVERDIAVGQWADLREAAAGEPCVSCGHPLEVERGIEVGHIFKLGYKFSDTIGLSVSGPDGKPVRPIMGCYGIGVERAMATAIEVHHDSKGIVWPVAIAPFEVVVVIAQQDDAAVAAAGEQAYQALLAAGVEVIVDDRQVRAGVKFSDAELVGIPFRITVGKRGVAPRIRRDRGAHRPCHRLHRPDPAGGRAQTRLRGPGPGQLREPTCRRQSSGCPSPRNMTSRRRRTTCR